jgi:hypothetical protein
MPDWGAGVCLSLWSACAAVQYEQQMLPPRLEMEKLEDDIIKQVYTQQPPSPPGLQQPRLLPSHTSGPTAVSALSNKLAPVSPVLPRVHCCVMRRCMRAWRSQTAAQS